VLLLRQLEMDKYGPASSVGTEQQMTDRRNEKLVTKWLMPTDDTHTYELYTRRNSQQVSIKGIISKVRSENDG